MPARAPTCASVTCLRRSAAASCRRATPRRVLRRPRVESDRSRSLRACSACPPRGDAGGRRSGARAEALGDRAERVAQPHVSRVQAAAVVLERHDQRVEVAPVGESRRRERGLHLAHPLESTWRSCIRPSRSWPRFSAFASAPDWSDAAVVGELERRTAFSSRRCARDAAVRAGTPRRPRAWCSPAGPRAGATRASSAHATELDARRLRPHKGRRRPARVYGPGGGSRRGEARASRFRARSRSSATVATRRSACASNGRDSRSSPTRSWRTSSSRTRRAPGHLERRRPGSHTSAFSWSTGRISRSRRDATRVRWIARTSPSPSHVTAL